MSVDGVVPGLRAGVSPLVKPTPKTVVCVGMEDVTACTEVPVLIVTVSRRVVKEKVGLIQSTVPICTLMIVSDEFVPPETTPWAHTCACWPA